MTRALIRTFIGAFLAVVSVSGLAIAERTKTVYNPFTSKLDYIVRIDSNTIIPGTGVTVDCVGGSCTINTTGGSGTSPVSGFYLKDSSNVKWYVVVDSSGALTTSVVSSVPAGTIYRTSIVIQDALFGIWTLTVNTSGALTTTSGGSTSSVIQDILINDSTGLTWVLTVNTSGTLVTS